METSISMAVMVMKHNCTVLKKMKVNRDDNKFIPLDRFGHGIAKEETMHQFFSSVGHQERKRAW